ncbi:MAG TPA: hypothetical protein VE398_16315 [Acidobacteriota bacterium]|nr:hypothetical protein [Acidobacteriota bacterium]
MDLFWMGVILVVVVLTYAATSIALVLLWRRSKIRRMEASLVQLQNQLVRVQSLLEEARARILGEGPDG